MKLNNRGFGAVEVILIIVIVGILGFVGWRAYSVYTEKPETGAEQSKYEFKNKEEPAQVTDSTEGYLVIKEWGVKLPTIQSDTLKYARNQDSKRDSIDITGVNLAKTGDHCDLGETVPAAIYRQKTEDSSPYSGELIDKIGEYYYYYSSPQATCVDNPDSSAGTLSAKVVSELRTNIKKLETVD